MSKLTSLFRQLELIKLAKKGPFSWDQVESLLEKKSEGRDLNLQISKRTLNRDLREIQELFGLVIEFDFKSARYRINTEESSENHLELIESFETIQAFGRANRLNGKVFFEKRLARGTEYLKPILEAIENKETVQIVYEKYWKWETETRLLRPIALKEYLHRWYVMAWTEKDDLRFFGLDRIKNLQTLPEKVKLPTAPDLESRFLETIGIINDPSEPVETVILTFTEFKGRYIQSMPLHPTQQILVNDSNILRISLRVKINYELVSAILSHGDEVRVEHPERLKKIVKVKAGNVFHQHLTP
ncbi:putative DNA-binding transcriptional regulator YafY [Algoriphagus aquaeductus]|uniref:Putative DNA-binding transcriptional regulator YafY n=1 Tax=Algoriphagus aquaeductus TaxID=475299 RepID=A0A326RN59_9BACT|nr:WYL domain-containing protein [Algoriphagus aquaeductus]PZV79578.1 putative DNA-binding transcriptional regulator YafY [Algoriphagus aquaeductus]